MQEQIWEREREKANKWKKKTTQKFSLSLSLSQQQKSQNKNHNSNLEKEILERNSGRFFFLCAPFFCFLFVFKRGFLDEREREREREKFIENWFFCKFGCKFVYFKSNFLSHSLPFLSPSLSLCAKQFKTTTREVKRKNWTEQKTQGNKQTKHLKWHGKFVP